MATSHDQKPMKKHPPFKWFFIGFLTILLNVASQWRCVTLTHHCACFRVYHRRRKKQELRKRRLIDTKSWNRNWLEKCSISMLYTCNCTVYIVAENFRGPIFSWIWNYGTFRGKNFVVDQAVVALLSSWSTEAKSPRSSCYCYCVFSARFSVRTEKMAYKHVEAHARW